LPWYPPFIGSGTKLRPKAKVPFPSEAKQGPNGTRQVQLVFDTGAALTQFHTPIIESVGYSAHDGLRPSNMVGPSGPKQPGYIVPLQKFAIFGCQFQKAPVGVFDFENFSEEGIDGLLGFDIIKEFHLEMNGPKGELIVFDS
jgi:hypothetical protein